MRPLSSLTFSERFLHPWPLSRSTGNAEESGGQVARLVLLESNSSPPADINETKILNAAFQFVSLGLADAGYEYVNIDDCWPLTTRDSSTGRIVPDPSKFPNGISGVADVVHALGLKLGIYRSQVRYVNFESHATSWISRTLKLPIPPDNCNVPGNWSDSSAGISAALNDTGRPFQFDICIWGNANVWDWGARVGHSWRMSGDASASWSYITSIITTNVQHLNSIDFYSHNDMDMMEIGNGALTIQEQRTHFAAWVLFKSPILLGTDLSRLNSTQVDIITNPELLAFHQDATIGTPAAPFTPTAGATIPSPPEFYAGASSRPRGTHVFIINTNSTAATMSFDFANVPGLGSGSFTVHDMWTGKDLGKFTTSFSATVDTHDTAALFIKPA
uniref:Alpha-galactosidase n=1 Tax=Ganoderma boninense TaxID=34458 RepID=A0A5K1JVJ5_9APHY|nr:Sulfatase domain-containing protein [Ganoderma boninense]